MEQFQGPLIHFFKTVVYQSRQKTVAIPLVHKGTKNVNNLTSYRPVSNIPFLTKVLEHLASSKKILFQKGLQQFDKNHFAS